jgi:hypothetical protein
MNSIKLLMIVLLTLAFTSKKAGVWACMNAKPEIMQSNKISFFILKWI